MLDSVRGRFRYLDKYQSFPFDCSWPLLNSTTRKAGHAFCIVHDIGPCEFKVHSAMLRMNCLLKLIISYSLHFMTSVVYQSREKHVYASITGLIIVENVIYFDTYRYGPAIMVKSRTPHPFLALMNAEKELCICFLEPSLERLTRG